MNYEALPLISQFINYIDSISGYSLPDSVSRIFENYDKNSVFLGEFLKINRDCNEKSNKWFIKHDESVHSLENMVAEILYRKDMISSIAELIIAYEGRHKLVSAIGTNSLHGGDVSKLNFEYHGFVFAYRTALDYLAQIIGAVLKQELNSYNGLPKSINKSKNNELARAVSDIYNNNVHLFSRYLTQGNTRGIRDQLAHYTFIQAAHLNVNASGIFLSDDGLGKQPKSLCRVIDNDCEALVGLIGQMFTIISVRTTHKCNNN